MNDDILAILKDINGQFGAGTINVVADVEEKLRVKRYKSPSHKFDAMLYGGIAKGKVIELYGEQFSGKTKLAMEIIAHNQKLDPNFVAAWWETEGSVDIDDLKRMGIDINRLVFWTQKSEGAEQGCEILRTLVNSGKFDLIAINSVAGLAPKAEMTEDISKQNVAIVARLLSKLFRIITNAATDTGTSLLFINQLRNKVGVMFGNPETTTGGKALGYYASQRVRMSRKNISPTGEPITPEEGVKIACSVRKNRYAKGNPFRVCEYYAYYQGGISGAIELPDILETEGILTKAGSWYYWRQTGCDPKKPTNVIIDGFECKWRSKKELVNTLRTNEPLRVLLEQELSKKTSTIECDVMSNEEIARIENEQAKIDKEFASIEKEGK